MKRKAHKDKITETIVAALAEKASDLFGGDIELDQIINLDEPGASHTIGVLTKSGLLYRVIVQAVEGEFIAKKRIVHDVERMDK